MVGIVFHICAGKFNQRQDVAFTTETSFLESKLNMDKIILTNDIEMNALKRFVSGFKKKKRCFDLALEGLVCCPSLCFLFLYMAL